MNKNLPLYKKIKLSLKDKIDSGEYLAGETIPSERDLAKVFGANRATIKKAIQSLCDDGILYTVPGSGTFVKKDDENYMLGIFDNKAFSSISTRFKTSGKKGHDKLVSNFTFKGFEGIASKLDLSNDDEIYTIVRQRFNGEDQIAALEYFYTNKALFPDIENYDFSKIYLYDYMEKNNLKPAKFERSLSIIHAPATIAKLLDIKKDRLIYCIEFIGRTQDNQIVEYTKSFMDTSKIRFEYTLSKD